jgi:hypothetical protein
MNKKTGIPAIDNDTEKLEKLEARSAKATGLVGKLFTLPHADSCAYYTVEEEKGQKVRVLNHALYDAWQDNILGAGGWVPRKQIEPIIRQQEGMAKIFETAAKKQKTEKEKYGEIVGTAALADLDATADVYGLASWAWKRSRRGPIKDDRLLKNGLNPWANDIAAALIDSGCFPTLKALKDPIAFIMLADKFEDPIIYSNDPPSVDVVLGKVMEAFQKAVGTDRVYNLKIVESDSKYLDNTYLTILGPSGNKVGSVQYDPKDGKIRQVNISFQMYEDGKVVSQ